MNESGNGHGSAASAGKRLIELLGRGDREVAIEPSTTASSKGDAPIAAKRARVSGRRRAEIAGKGVVIEGPSSGKQPKLSAGVVLTRQYKGRRIAVTVLGANAFEYEGRRYRSLSAIANEITKSHVSGVRWFGLNKPRAKRGAKS